MLEIQTFLSLGFATNTTFINYKLFKTHSKTNPLNLPLTQSQTIEQTHWKTKNKLTYRAMPEIHKFSQAAIKVTSLSHGFTADTTFTNYIALIRSPIVEAVFFFSFFFCLRSVWLALWEIKIAFLKPRSPELYFTTTSPRIFFNKCLF